MHSCIIKLHAILDELQGKDLAQMSPEAIDALRVSVTEKFTDATGGLHALLLGDHAEESRWLWKAEQADSFGNEWISTYTLLDTGQMESALGKPEKVRLAAALFPSLSLVLDIFAEYHHPGGTGLQVDPMITLRLVASDEPVLSLVEHYFDLSHEFFPKPGNGLKVEIFPHENCCDEIQNPAEIHKAFHNVADAARSAGDHFDDGVVLTERVDLILSMDRSISVQRMQDAFEYLGQMFTSIQVSMK